MNSKLAVFDFDGTITKKDTLFLFIIFVKGMKCLILGILLNSLVLLRYKLGFLSNSLAKEKLFMYFFKDMDYSDFCNYGNEFINKINETTRIKAVEQIKKYNSLNIPVYVISASIKEWVEPWCIKNGIEKVIATEIGVDSNNRLTGKFITPNCYGIEKINRLSNTIENRQDLYIIAYGDSSGDKELLDYSDEGHLNAF